mgnify:CR=1 FL=1
MELIEVNNLIKELESVDSSLSTARNLAALYIIQGQLQGRLTDVVTQSNDAVLTELYEVIPSYKQYVVAKRRYKLNEISEDIVISTLSRLGKEITDFIKTLYTATASDDERKILHKIVQELKDVI